MKVIQYFISLLIFIGLIIADKTQDKVFKEVKEFPTKDGILYIKSASQFNRFVTNPRNFSMAIAFTVLGERYDCTPCRQLNQHLKTVASSLEKSENKDQLFIASIDFEDVDSIFKKYQLAGAPNLFFYPPIEEKNSNPKYEIYSEGYGDKALDDILEFINKYSQVKVVYTKPIDFVSLGVKSVLFITFVTLVYRFSNNVQAFIQSKRLWSAITLVFILTMVSGQMWNNIRNPTYTGISRDGSLNWYAAGFQEQMGLESHVVAVIYGVATYAIIYLGRNVRKIKNDWVQSFLSIAFLVIFIAALSFAMALFKLKFPHYPFSLLL